MAKRANGEGSISKRGDGRWWARYTVPTSKGPKRRAIYGNSREEVRKKLTAALATRDSGGVDFDAEKITFGEWLHRWLSDSARDSVAERTLMTYEQRVSRHLEPALGHLQLRKLTAAHLQALYREKLDGTDHEPPLSTSSVLGLHCTVSGALRQAYRLGVIRENPAGRVQLPRLSTKEIHALTDEEARRVLATARDSEDERTERLYALYALALATGLRHGELLGLRWSDVDLSNHKIAVRRQFALTRAQHEGGKGYDFKPPKGGKSRTVSLGAGAVSALNEHRTRQKRERLEYGPGYHESDQIFTYPDGRPLAPWLSQRIWRELAAEATVEGTRFHDLRHTYATLALAANVPAKVVQEAMGHGNVKITLDTYSHVLPNMATEAASKVDQALF